MIIATVFRSLAQDKDCCFVFILKIKRLFKNDSYSYRYIITYPGYLAKFRICNLYFPHKIPPGFFAFTTCLRSGFIIKTKSSKFRTET